MSVLTYIAYRDFGLPQLDRTLVHSSCRTSTVLLECRRQQILHVVLAHYTLVFLFVSCGLWCGFGCILWRGVWDCYAT